VIFQMKARLIYIAVLAAAAAAFLADLADSLGLGDGHF
jgi:hypothetical protein